MSLAGDCIFTKCVLFRIDAKISSDKLRIIKVICGYVLFEDNRQYFAIKNGKLTHEIQAKAFSH